MTTTAPPSEAPARHAPPADAPPAPVQQKPVVYVHVGLPKTGTTTIQTVLRRNRAALQAQGWQYLDILPIDPLRYNLALALRGGYGAALRRTLARVDQPRAIVSEERLDMFLADDPGAPALIAALRARFDLRACIFLRRQDHHAESWVSQRAKIAHPWGMASTSARRLRAERFDFRARIAQLESLFGAGKVEVGFFRDDRRGDSLAEFARLTGLDIAGLKRPAASQNVTPNRRVTLYLARVGKTPFLTKRFVLRPILETGCVAGDGQKFLLSPAARRRFLEPNIDGNRAVCARFGPDHAEWFTALPEDDGTWTPPAPLTPEEEAAVFRAATARPFRRHGRLLGAPGALVVAARLLIARWRRPHPVFLDAAPLGDRATPAGARPAADPSPRA